MALPVVFKFGTRADYDALEAKAENALYFLTDTGELLRGEVNLAKGMHYSVVKTDPTISDIEAIEATVSAEGNIPGFAVKEDIAVVKTLIAENANGEKKYSYTSYVYDGEQWNPMDGNYNAANVYLDEDLVMTHNVGALELGNENYKAVETAGKSLKEILEAILKKEVQPIRESVPEVTVELHTDISTEDQAYEVGTLVVPTYKATLSAGEYTFGPETGIVATSWNVTGTLFEGEEEISTQSLDLEEGSFTAVTLGDNSVFDVVATAVYGDGADPVTNLGNPAEAGIKFEADSATNEVETALVGYRAMFYGPEATDGEITSEMVRELRTDGPYDKEQVIEIKNDGQAKRFMVAYPANSERPGVVKAISNSFSADVTSYYEVYETEVEVEGANGYTAIPYKVWTYHPASIASNTVHTITMG